MQRSLIVLTIMFAVAVGTANSQNDVDWQIASAQRLELPDVSAPIHHAIPAPDGRTFAYGDRGEDDLWDICAYDSVEETSICVDSPPDMQIYVQFDDTLKTAAWSPDSTRLAVVGSPLLTLEDSDLLMVDFAEGTLENLGDDGYSGDLISPDAAAQGGIFLDIQPTWSPDGTQLLTQRTYLNQGGGLEPPSLVLIDTTTGDAQELLGADAASGTLFGADWTPDGSAIAVSLTNFESEPVTSDIWTIDVASGEAVQIVSHADVFEALASIYSDLGQNPNDAVHLIGLDWSPDGERLLFWAIDQHFNLQGMIWAFWVDADGSNLTAMNIPQNEEFADSPVVASYPWQAVWTPESDALLVQTVELLPTNYYDAPTIDPEAAEGQPVPLHWITVPENETTLIGTLLYNQLSWATKAVWGVDGRVHMYSYVLQMEAQ